jgi:dTDP-4-amino-4,6-dideoxygalactose transaminase
MKPKYYHHAVGANFRLDALQAAFLRVKLPKLAAYTEARRRNAALYRHAFVERKLASEPGGCALRGEGRESEPLTLPAACQPGSIWNQFVVRVASGKRDALLEHLRAKKVGAEVYYPLALHDQKCFAGVSSARFPESERAARETLALPIFPELEERELRFVVDAVASFFKK